MKKTILNATLLIIMLATSAFQTAATSQEAVWKLLVSIPAGKQSGEIAYLSQEGYGRMQGPESFAVSPDGTVYVLDSVNTRILYKAKGVVKSIKLPGALYPTDIRWQNGNAVILDDSNRILRYSADGKMLRKTNLPADVKSEQVYSLAEDDGKIGMWTQNSHAFDLDALPSAADLSESSQAQGDKGLGPGIPAPDGTRWQAMYDGLTQGLFVTPDGKHKIVVEAYGLFGSARLVGFDKQSNLYILVEDLYDAAPDKLGVEMSIRKYAPEGALLGAAVFPTGEAVVPSSHPVQVTANGQVYAMIARKQAVAIYAVTLGKGYQPKAYRVPLDQGASTQKDVSSEGIQAQVGTAFKRWDVYDRAKKMTTVAWMWYSSYDWINGDLSQSGVDTKRSGVNAPKPSQLPTGLVDGITVIGIPYYWGGFDSQWTKSDWATGNWINWGTALSHYRPSKGPLVGNARASGDSVRGGAGIDCSGFVAAASGNTYAAKPGTGRLTSDTNPLTYNWLGGEPMTVSLRRLQPMNMLATSSHILYYTRRSLDLGGISSLESTIGGGAPQGAKAYTHTMSELNSFTYHRSWWPKATGDGPDVARTAQGAGSACYKLAGQTVWYKFTVPAGTRNVTLTGISGGDPDLYVYTAAFGQPLTSYHSGTTNESVTISAGGIYYAMVHIWTAPTTGCVTWTINW